MSRQKHSEEFKREAVRLTYEPGRTLKEIGDHLGINASMLWRWRERVKRDGEDAFLEKGKPKATARRPKATDDEVARLRRELARVTEEREILKKAVAFFANQRT
jgi:transposase